MHFPSIGHVYPQLQPDLPETHSQKKRNPFNLPTDSNISIQIELKRVHVIMCSLPPGNRTSTGKELGEIVPPPPQENNSQAAEESMRLRFFHPSRQLHRLMVRACVCVCVFGIVQHASCWVVHRMDFTCLHLFLTDGKSNLKQSQDKDYVGVGVCVWVSDQRKPGQPQTWLRALVQWWGNCEGMGAIWREGD